MLLMAVSCGIDLGRVQIGTLLFGFKKNRRNRREHEGKKNEIINENEIMNEEVRKLVECPKQQYWSKYQKRVQIESRNEQNDVVTDMAPRFRPCI
jgi:hypothetical protein